MDYWTRNIYINYTHVTHNYISNNQDNRDYFDLTYHNLKFIFKIWINGIIIAIIILFMERTFNLIFKINCNLKYFLYNL